MASRDYDWSCIPVHVTSLRTGRLLAPIHRRADVIVQLI